MTRVTLRDGDRWVACSMQEFGDVGSVRHIVRGLGVTTACGCTASHADIWRGNTTKPRCASCVEKVQSRNTNDGVRRF